MRNRSCLGSRCLLFAALGLLLGCQDRSRLTATQLEARLSRILELPTAEYLYKDILYFGHSESFLFIPTVDKRLLFSIRFRVQAGYDLREGLSVASEGGRLRVGLPAPRVLLVDAEEQSIHEYFLVQRGGLINRLDYAEEIERVKPKISQDALDRGILGKARENAGNLIHGFLTLAGFDEVVITEGAP